MLAAVSAVAVAALAAAPAMATVFNFFNQLQGTQETPPNASPATGTVSATYNDISKIFDLKYHVTGLLAPIQAGHIHNAPIGVPGPIILDLSLVATAGISEPLGAFPQTPDYEVVFDFATNPGLAFLNVTETLSSFETQLLSENLYLNLHTQSPAGIPTGEVRGQLLLVQEPVPEPETVLLLATALVGIGLATRRRRA